MKCESCGREGGQEYSTRVGRVVLCRECLRIHRARKESGRKGKGAS